MNKTYVKLPENDVVRSDTADINRKHSQMVYVLTKHGDTLLKEFGSDHVKVGTAMDILGNFVNAGRMLDKMKRMFVYNEDFSQPEPYLKAVKLDEVMFHFTPEKMELLHHAVGIATEASEILERVLDELLAPHTTHEADNIPEECGDLEFYLKGYRGVRGIYRDDTLLHNMSKLAKRYKDYQYSDEQAAQRNDKKETQ